MTESKYAKYVLTEPAPDREVPKVPPGTVTPMIYLDDGVIKGAFNVMCAWFWPTKEATTPVTEPHKHNNNEVVGFFGSNPDDPHDLCGEIEFWVEDEQLVLTKSFLIYIPPMVKHCPLILRRVDRPIFHFSALTEAAWNRLKA